MTGSQRAFRFVIKYARREVDYYEVVQDQPVHGFGMSFLGHNDATLYCSRTRLAQHHPLSGDTYWVAEVDIAVLIARDKLIEEGLIPDEWDDNIPPPIVQRSMEHEYTHRET